VNKIQQYNNGRNSLNYDDHMNILYYLKTSWRKNCKGISESRVRKEAVNEDKG